MAARLETNRPPQHAALPSWFFSLALHGLIVMLLVSSVPATRRGGAGETSRSVGLVRLGADIDSSGSDDNRGDTDRSAVDAQRSPVDADTQSAAVQPPSQSSAAETAKVAKPQRTETESSSAGEQPAGESPTPGAPAPMEPDANIESLTETADQLQGSIDGQSGQTVAVGEALRRGKGRTKVFGIPGEGYKFVYVFDRSASMGGSGRSTLAAAKAELLKSLQSLGETHQFQIIFYNEEPSILNIAGRSRLVFGTPQNKELARRFVGGITADGATRHEEALLLALRLKPDVIYFLTDADDPVLSDAQLQRIHQIADGVTAINTIEFGAGPQIGGDNFLARLAHENAGQYAYFDITALKEGK